MRIESKDLWQSAYVLAKGGELEDVRIDGHNGRRRMAIFILSGPDVRELAREFRTGHALCDVVRLRSSMIHLKDLMFEMIRER